MEKPYSVLSNKPLAAPADDMEEIVIATLNGMQFGKFTYVDTPKTLQATKEDTELWSDKPFKSAYAVEIIWYDDPQPPPQFEHLAMDNEFIQPLLVTVKVKDLKSDAQGDATELAKSIWNQLKERAQETAKAAKSRKKPTDHGTAAWATLQEVTDEGYVQEETTDDPSTRLLIGSFKSKTISVPKQYTEAHAVVAGPPGVGKSRTIFIPNLIERLGTSALVTEVVAAEDIKPVVFRMTAGYRQANGHKVFYLNPSDLHNSTRFNPIDFITGVEDAIYYANLIISNTTEKSHMGDQIWKQSETHLLTALLLYAWGLGGKKKSQEGGLANLGHIRELLRHGPITLDKLINSNGIAEARNRFGEFIRNSSPNFRLGVFSGLIQRLNPWLNPTLIKLTEVSDFSDEELRTNLFTFYLAYPVNRPEYQPIMALALNFLTKLALRKTFEKPLTLLLDEFAAYGRIPGIDDLQATIRNRNIGIVLGFQDQQQLEKSYTQHEASVLFTNSNTKIMFATGSERTQKQISQLLSQETRVKKQVSSSGHITKQTFGAPLMAPGEVGTRIKEGQVLVIRNKRNPLMADTCPLDKYNAYEHNYPAPEKPKKYVDPAMFDQAEKAAQLEFSQDEADQQMSQYEKLWRAKTELEDQINEAKKQNKSPQVMKVLEKELEKAQDAYDKFVAPEGPTAPLLDPEEKELVPKTKHKPASEQKPPVDKDPAPAATTTESTSAPFKPKPATAAEQAEDDPFKGLYDDSATDPFEKYYDNSGTDPFEKYYDDKNKS